ncbi:MAG: glycosyltransferase family 2 protein [Clostridiales bacterium]|nr:glycosyltransferase family 2 protein [Clostridiales bacterium]
MKELLIIIPAYNESMNIVRVVDNLTQNYPQYDYIVVNDGSSDRTADICREHHFNLLDLPINLGLAGAFQAGLKYAYRTGYSYAIQYDGDGQHRAEYIGDLLAKAKEGYDVVIGSRFVNRKKPFTARMMGSRLISALIRLTSGVQVKDSTSGMRLFGPRMIWILAMNMNYGPEPDTISYLAKCGARIAEVQVEMDERIAGESYLNLIRSVTYMVQMTISILVVQFFRKKHLDLE